jgi:hypothetical protein
MDLEESRLLRRRKSSTDSILERNISFVDTPGDRDSAVVDYVESLLYQTSSIPSLEDSDIVGLVSGSGGLLVDLVLYLLPPSKSNPAHS